MTSQTKAIAKVVLLTKDETHIIEDFLIFYGELFGYANVIVVDNGTTCQDVLTIYETYKKTKDVTVIVDERPFVDARIFMTEHMKSIADTCEWILPLETDEFMYCIPQTSSNSFFLKPKDVEVYLRSIPDNVSVINYGTLMGSVVNPTDESYNKSIGAYTRPTTDMVQFYNQGWDKLIVRASEFVRMSQWCHHAEMKTHSKDMCLKSDFLGLLHYHDTGFRRKLDSAARVLQSFNYIPNIRVSACMLSNIEDVRRKHQACQVLIDRGVACGHKIEYYDLFLRRMLAVNALKDLYNGRTPSCYEELDYLTISQSDPEMAIMKHKLMNDMPTYESTQQQSPPSVEMLLFHDSHPTITPQETVTVSQVKNFFLSHCVGNELALYTYLFSGMCKKGGCTVEAILEMGVSTGASTQSLSERFPDAVVVGIDNTLDNVKYGKENPMVTYIKGNYEVAKSLCVYFDLVIDRGSSKSDKEQVAAFDAFAPFLRPGGTFIIECCFVFYNHTEMRNELEKVAEKHKLVTPIDWLNNMVAVIRDGRDVTTHKDDATHKNKVVVQEV